MLEFFSADSFPESISFPRYRDRWPSAILRAHNGCRDHVKEKLKPFCTIADVR